MDSVLVVTVLCNVFSFRLIHSKLGTGIIYQTEQVLHLLCTIPVVGVLKESRSGPLTFLPSRNVSNRCRAEVCSISGPNGSWNERLGSSSTQWHDSYKYSHYNNILASIPRDAP